MIDDTSSKSSTSSGRGLEWECLKEFYDKILSHPESHVFGIHPKVKSILNDLIEKNVLYLKPLQAHIYLNMDDLINGEMKGLPMPDKNQIKYYIRSYRNTNNVFSNKVEDVKNLIKNSQFHTVAFALVSHESSSDFDWFFGSIKNLFMTLGIVFNIMMDASDAVRQHFPNCHRVPESGKIITRRNSL
ncbi:unnamed protein product [Brachionus calyciflorus]|uniref:Uncharacterized protein n=1 Tax=Brachionus calyciflorus TaxID=104777 RepID=A0A814BR10_9BILA|nr:unnamed protein product [Brachionus calyciflorus]